MPFLSASQLASMRAVTSATIAGRQTTVEIQENQGAKPGQVVSDGIGGARDNWVSIASYAGEIQEVRPEQKSTEAAQTRATELYNFFLPWDAVVTAANRLRCEGAIYEIKNTNSHVSQRTSTVVMAALTDEGDNA